MDLENTLNTIAASIPQELAPIVSGAAAYLPEELTQILDHAASYMPTQIDLITSVQFMLYFALGSLVMGLLSRVVLGKRSSLNHSLSSAVGILFVYVLTVVIYTFKPWNLESFLSPLPFVTFSGEYLIVFPIGNSQIPALCTEVLSMVILAFLVNLLDSFLPRGNNVFVWYLLRLLTTAAAMALHFVVRQLLHAYLPDVLVTYAPTILLVVLAFMLLSGFLNLILGLVITIVDPFMGAMYTFFFSNIIGKQLSKAIFSSAILCGIIYLMEYYGYTVISITAGALMAYIPLVLVLMLLWYLIGHVL